MEYKWDLRRECSALYTLDELLELKTYLGENNKLMVFTNGCFDLIHPGHLRLLRIAKSMGDFLLVGLNSDDSISRLKGSSRPIMPLEARALLLCNLKTVDGIIVFNEDTPLNIIDKLQPDIYVKGIGHRADQMPEIPRVTSYGGCAVLLGSLSEYSTTGIINKIIAQREIKQN